MAGSFSRFLHWVRNISFLPRNQRFFVIYQAQVDEIHFAATQLSALANNSHHAVKRGELHREIKQSESRGDQLVRDLSRLINDAITTPFSRDAIMQFGQILDDILDGIESAADTLVNFEVHNPPDDVRKMVELIAQAADCFQNSIGYFSRFENPIEIYEVIREIEHAADEINKLGIARVYLSATSVNDLVDAQAFSRVIARLEDTADKFRHAADTMKGVIAKRV